MTAAVVCTATVIAATVTVLAVLVIVLAALDVRVIAEVVRKKCLDRCIARTAFNRIYLKLLRVTEVLKNLSVFVSLKSEQSICTTWI